MSWPARLGRLMWNTFWLLRRIFSFRLTASRTRTKLEFKSLEFVIYRVGRHLMLARRAGEHLADRIVNRHVGVAEHQDIDPNLNEEGFKVQLLFKQFDIIVGGFVLGLLAVPELSHWVVGHPVDHVVDQPVAKIVGLAETKQVLDRGRHVGLGHVEEGVWVPNGTAPRDKVRNRRGPIWITKRNTHAKPPILPARYGLAQMHQPAG